VGGLFTQEDPIGLAGGMNLYGFAGGDPINFSDPFGLCPWCVGALVGVAFEGATQLISGDLNGEALGAAFIIGGISGGVSVGSRIANLGLQAGLGAADGAARALATGQGYTLADAALDAGVGLVGEGFGDAARGFAVPRTQAGRSLQQLDGGASVMTPAGQSAFRGILDKRLGQIEAAVAGAASGLAARIGALFNKDDDTANRRGGGN
jgi:hypothetical protein